MTITMPGYLKSSYALKEEIEPLMLPPAVRLFTSDCKKMYPSIKTYWALQLITDFVHSNNSEFEYDADALCDASRLLMENMVF